MTQTPEDKASRYLTDGLADSRFSEIVFARKIMRQPHAIQVRFYNVIVAFIYANAHNYEVGHFPRGTYEIARVCKKIKDLALSDEYTTVKYAKYGDYEMGSDLTQFDVAE